MYVLITLSGLKSKFNKHIIYKVVQKNIARTFLVAIVAVQQYHD